MPSEVIVALIAASGGVLGSFFGMLINNSKNIYRIEQLEKKMDKHNGIVEKTYRLEEQMKVANHRIHDLEEVQK